MVVVVSESQRTKAIQQFDGVREFLPNPERQSKVFLAEETAEGVLHFVPQKGMKQQEQHIFVDYIDNARCTGVCFRDKSLLVQFQLSNKCKDYSSVRRKRLNPSLFGEWWLDEAHKAETSLCRTAQCSQRNFAARKADGM